ncbi:MAG: hypothetical protein Sylvanvirus4_2 [Sylvanvirus sp.]|uniref:Uncharacterized protein n=1 Tax=Sylvanvirus sp. TaxID=2487774 RepID=A0A3G5AHH2_9VIRU|nr:MAG: hypothetical protein Sylvanvirus4_2 [Sylvanvirus sp.]
MNEIESSLITNKHIFLCIPEQVNTLECYHKEVTNLQSHFCGLVFTDIKTCEEYMNMTSANIGQVDDTMIYICGDILKNYTELKDLLQIVLPLKWNIIQELSHNYEEKDIEITITNSQLIGLGQVPLNIYNTGVYFRKYFNSNRKSKLKDYFDLVSHEHEFQSLTESDKPSDALRTGIYLTKIVEEVKEELKLNLLRCSSNLRGPTGNFKEIDVDIVNQVNTLSSLFFKHSSPLNHVLAQVYENKLFTKSNDSSSIARDSSVSSVSSLLVEKKAKIKEHSDKSKDMNRNGLIAFCTFYKSKSQVNDVPNNIQGNVSEEDIFDYRYKKVTVLTKLRFRLKKTVTDTTLKKQFDIVLYPDSVFIISLWTNRLYTHEIVPSVLPLDKLPIRLGYVIRCSKTEAVFKNNQMFIYENGTCIPLQQPDIEGVKELKALYSKENVTDEVIHYRKFYFSLNKGDYERPIV